MGEVTGSPLSAPARFDPLKHDVSSFDCGKPPLNEWLRKLASKSEGVTARTYVACAGTRVVGYYCIAAGSIERATIPASMKQHGQPNLIPVALIGRLACDLSYQGRGLGADLLSDALKRILIASSVIGIRAVLVHALDAQAASFYTRYGFLRCPVAQDVYALPIDTIAAAL